MRRLTWPSLLAALGLFLAACDTGNGAPPPPEKYTVSGSITDGNDNPIAGVIVDFGDVADAVSTGADGRWERTDLQGTVTVTPTLAGFAFDPESHEVDKAADNVDFTAHPRFT